MTHSITKQHGSARTCMIFILRFSGFPQGRFLVTYYNMPWSPYTQYLSLSITF